MNNMKRIFTIITLLAMIILAGCTDLDDIYRQLDEQKKDFSQRETADKRRDQRAEPWSPTRSWTTRAATSSP